MHALLLVGALCNSSVFLSSSPGLFDAGLTLFGIGVGFAVLGLVRQTRPMRRLSQPPHIL